MPEGPEVRAVADAIKKGTGTVFEAAAPIENVPGKIHRFTRNGVENLDVLQQRWVLEDVFCKGKLIRLDIRILKSGELWHGFSTLGMSGDWRWNSGGHKHARLSFLTRDGKDLTFVDMRCYGTFRVVTPEKATEIINKIGWDLLVAPMPKKRWAQLQQHRRLRNKPIGVSLLDQSLFSGIGNIYKAEIMYSLGIDPKQTIGQLDPVVWERVNTAAHRIMQKAYRLGGSSIRDYTADGVEGTAQDILQIYGKEQCPRGHSVSSFKQKDRTTWWCSVCQTEKSYGTITNSRKIRR